MSVTTDQMTAWCRAILGADGALRLPLAEQLEQIPRLAALRDLPAGSIVLVRGDVDCKPGAEIGAGDIRLRSMLGTLRFGHSRGWKQVICGHIGRKPEGSLSKVRARLEELLAAPVAFVEEWLDEKSLTLTPAATEAIANLPNGGFLLLENTRRYAIERVLWKAKPGDLPKLAGDLAKFAHEIATKIGTHYVNEALSAGSLDTSTVVLPAAMSQAVLGEYVAGEFDGPMRRCLETELVVFSGLKIDKLDDLQAMIDRGKIRHVFAAGSLAVALKKGAVELDGGKFSLGVAEDAGHSDKPYYIPPERIEQARTMIAKGRQEGIEFVLPVDFVLADGRVAAELGPGDQQFDIGPATSELFARKVGEFIAAVQARPAGSPPAVAFHNGVFGMFEDPRFEAGTKKFIGELKRMKDAGIEVYIGGGEGGTALERYGQPDWVTHCFTAGGTVLNALGSEPVPYLVALRRRAQER
ncbi:MAG: phosphoglycerate kinase [Planctomycetaceae bacterium]|nr:phosphoglycerate kinase [Planctomycetaceae bacterium]